MSFYFPTEFGEEYWKKAQWLRVGSTIMSLPALEFVGGWLNFRGAICALPFIWSSVHLILIFRKFITHPLLNAGFDLTSIALLIFMLSFKAINLWQSIFRFIIFPVFLGAICCLGLSCLREVTRYRRNWGGSFGGGVQLP